MNEETKKLNVGDVIYLTGNYGIHQRANIDRVTNTLAFSGTNKFKREYTDWLTIIGYRERWSTTHWEVETPELKYKFINQKTIESIKRHSLFKNIQKLKNEELQGLLDHMDNLNKQF